MKELMVQRAAQCAVIVQPKTLIGFGWIHRTLQDGRETWFELSYRETTRLEGLEAQKNVGVKASGIIVAVDALGCWQSSSISLGSATEIILLIIIKVISPELFNPQGLPLVIVQVAV
jgi:hypothetical protein